MPKDFRPPFLRPIPSPSGSNPAPAVVSVVANTDRIAGGASVTITGAYFQTGATVQFGGVAATGVTVVNSSTITCTTPAHAAGVVDVVVTNPNGTAGTLAAGFTYVTSVLASVSPPSGSYLGGDPVTITGSNFVAGSSITFDGVAATAVAFVSATTYTCTTPAGVAGKAVDIVLTEALGATATLSRSFLYVTVVIPQGQPAPLLNQPTSPNTTPPTGSFTETQAGLRWTPTVSYKASLGNAPNTCTFTVDGSATPPQVNVDVSFVYKGNLKFAGTILQIDSTYEDAIGNRIYSVTAVDYTWQLNRYQPRGRYDKKLPSAIIRDLVLNFAPGYSVAYIDPGIDSNGPISIRLSGVGDFTSTLTEVCRNAGDTHFKVDNYKNIRVFEGTDPTRPAVTPLVDGLASPRLYNNPAPRLSEDISQIRNKVTVVGKGTSSIKNSLKLTNIPGTSGYDATQPNYDGTASVQSAICVSSIDGFAGLNGSGGYILVDGLILKYTAALTFFQSGGVVPDPGAPDHGTKNIVIDYTDATTAANAALLLVNTPYDAGPSTYGATYKDWPDGLSVAPMVIVQDSGSIATYGVHEYTVPDSSLIEISALTARGNAELKKFAQPIYKLTYTSDDDNNVPGAFMRADLSSPLIHANFVLQEVELVHDEFGFRYNVVADTAARYEFNDLLLDLDTPAPSLATSLVGLVQTAKTQAVNQIPAVANQIFSVTKTFSIGNGASGINDLATVNTNPPQLVPGVGNSLITPLCLQFRYRCGPFPTGANPSLSARWKGFSNDLTFPAGIMSGSNLDKVLVLPLDSASWGSNDKSAVSGADLVLFGNSNVTSTGESNGVIDTLEVTVFYFLQTIGA